MSFHVHRSLAETMSGTDTWRCNLSRGRLQATFTVYCHHGLLPDRWVFQTNFVYDRKTNERRSQ